MGEQYREVWFNMGSEGKLLGIETINIKLRKPLNLFFLCRVPSFQLLLMESDGDAQVFYINRKNNTYLQIFDVMNSRFAYYLSEITRFKYKNLKDLLKNI